jgi:hypothetical protein
MNKRRSFIKKISMGLMTAGLIPFAENTAASEIKIADTLVHHVFFWLKEPENRENRKQFEKALKDLLKIKTIRLSHTGVPASTEKRDVVDHSYTYSFMLFFESKEDQEEYQKHPLHLKFVEENSHLWNKVVVYDSTDI